MSEKNNSVNIMDYNVAKNGTTKYLKIQCSPKADAKTKKLVEDLKALLGTDVLFVNLFSQEFKDQYGIPEFAKGRISVATDAKPAIETNAPVAKPAPAKQKPSNDGVNF